MTTHNKNLIFNEFPVGADLSCPATIYRPSGKSAKSPASPPQFVTPHHCAPTLPNPSSKIRNCVLHLLISMIACTFILLSFSPIIAHASVIATGNGRIYGQLLNGTENNAPVAHQSLTLQMAQGDNASDLKTITTDAHGAFSFDGLDTGKTINYAIFTRYQGAPYVTNLIDLSTKPVQQVSLTVYDATNNSAKLSIVQTIIVLDSSTDSPGVITVSEYFFFKNPNTRTYVGSLKPGSGKPNALLFTLPPGARNVSLTKGFDGSQTIEVDTGFATDAAVPPGISQFVFSFQVTYTASQYDFSYKLLYPTTQLSVLVPSAQHASSSGLASVGIITANSHPYHLFEGKNLQVGTTVRTQISGLPAVIPTNNPSPLNTGVILLIVGLLIMLAILCVTWFLYRSTRRPTKAKHNSHYNEQKGKRNHGRGNHGGGVETQFIASPRGGGASGEQSSSILPAVSDTIDTTANNSQNEQQALLEKLLALDKAFEAGKIKKSIYQERRAKIKAQLRTLMSTEIGEK